jgi:pyruvate dehydrogenase E1 component beta subunit
MQKHRGPVVMLEHRLMYELEFAEDEPSPSSENPLFGSILVREGSDLTLVATSVMVLEARRAAAYLEKFGISVEIIDLHSISHPNKSMIIDSVKKTRKLIVADTSWPAYGVASEIARIVCEQDPSLLISPLVSLGMRSAPCPTAKVLEDMYYPDVHDIVASVLTLIDPQKVSLVRLPPKESMTDYYKHFKGPF